MKKMANLPPEPTAAGLSVCGSGGRLAAPRLRRHSVPGGRGSPKHARTLKEFLDFIRSYEWIDWWRFELCVIVSLALAGLVYLLVVDRSAGSRISLAVIIIGSMTGLIWQWRKRRMI